MVVFALGMGLESYMPNIVLPTPGFQNEKCLLEVKKQPILIVLYINLTRSFANVAGLHLGRIYFHCNRFDVFPWF